MKTRMKLFTALTITMGFASSAIAQSQFDDADIDGKATVSAQVAVASGTSLDFKNVTPGVDKTINFNSVVTEGIATGGETTGHFTITKGTNTQVALEFTTLPTALSGVASSSTEGESLPISYTAQLYKASTPPHTIATPTEGTTVLVASSSTTAPYFATGEFQLDLGGTVSPAIDQAAGDYQSTITLTATYN